MGIVNNFSNTRTPVLGKPIPLRGCVAFLDLNWSEKFTTSAGYSRVDVDNTHGQANTAFKSGQYGLMNLLYYPVKGVMLGLDVQWGYRDNKATIGSNCSAKYNFGFGVGGN